MTPACTLLPDAELLNRKIASISVHAGGTILLGVYAHPADMHFTLHMTPSEALVIAAALTDAAALAADRITENAEKPE